jgi:hypothetical protein
MKQASKFSQNENVWHMEQRSHSSTRNISGALTSTASFKQENTWSRVSISGSQFY